MPTSSERQRNLMKKWFGNSIDSEPPMQFLLSHGFKLTRGWEWIKPVEDYEVSCYEWECIAFLIDEWDFGGFFDKGKIRLTCLCGQREAA